MTHYKLFIDESGKPHASHHAKYFVQVGCLVEDSKRLDLKIRADQIKFKYWGKSNIVFHSEHIGKFLAPFDIFKDNPVLRKEFEKDLLEFLQKAPYQIIVRVTDKAYTKRWNPETVLRKSTAGLLTDYVAFLYIKALQSRTVGRVVFEASSFDQDKIYLQVFNSFLYPSWEAKNPDFTNVREKMTSITYATKLNHDTEVQIADLFGYAAICKVTGQATTNFQKKLVQILDSKLLKKPRGVTSKERRNYYKRLKGIELLQK